MNIKKEEKDPSMNFDQQNLLSQQSTLRSKFQKRELHHTSSQKLVTIQNSIKKMTAGNLIKKNDFRQIERKILLEEQKVDENSDIQIYLHNLKKSHDELVKQIAKKQKQSQKLKQQIDTMKKKIKLGNQKSMFQKSSIQDMQKRYDNLKLKQQTSKLASKTFQHILQRMKKDEIVYKIKNNDLQKKAKELNIQIVENTTKNISLHQFQTLSLMASSNIKNVFNQVNDRRLKDMKQYSLILQRKKDSEKKKQQRQKVTQQIQAMAASDMNDANLIKWKKLLMVQKFLKKFLKQKMLNLQIKYKQIKDAFHKIKSKTTVSDPINLAPSFFNLEDTYTNLLGNIRNLQQKQNKLQKINKGLKQKYQAQKIQVFLFEQLNQNEAQGLKFKVQFKQLVEKSMMDELTHEKIYFWMINNLYKLQKTNEKFNIQKKQYYELFPKSSLAQGILKLCDQLIKQSNIIKQTNLNQTVDYTKLRQLQKVVVTFSDQDDDQNHKNQQIYSRAIKSKKTLKLL